MSFDTLRECGSGATGEQHDESLTILRKKMEKDFETGCDEAKITSASGDKKPDSGEILEMSLNYFENDYANPARKFLKEKQQAREVVFSELKGRYNRCLEGLSLKELLKEDPNTRVVVKFEDRAGLAMKPFIKIVEDMSKLKEKMDEVNREKLPRLDKLCKQSRILLGERDADLQDILITYHNTVEQLMELSRGAFKEREPVAPSSRRSGESSVREQQQESVASSKYPSLPTGGRSEPSALSGYPSLTSGGAQQQSSAFGQYSSLPVGGREQSSTAPLSYFNRPAEQQQPYQSRYAAPPSTQSGAGAAESRYSSRARSSMFGGEATEQQSQPQRSSGTGSEAAKKISSLFA